MSIIRPVGNQLVGILAAITVCIWFVSKNTLLAFSSDPLTTLAQIFGLTGLLLMMINLTLSTRLRFIEDLWGGLDKVYESHHVTGMTSFLLLVSHPLLMAAQALPDVAVAVQYFWPGSYLPYTFGILAQYIMYIVFVFILIVKLPYHIWKRTHQAMGLVAILGATHALLIPSDISVFIPLRLWMIFWIIAGISAFLYIFFLYDRIPDVFVYEVEGTEKYNDVISIRAKPRRRKMAFVSGQFAYVAFENPKVGNEQHPFSISSSPHEDTIRFSIKMLGDYTRRLAQVKKGDRMFLKGPHGRFGRHYLEGSNPLVWIVGGIGITPFLSMLRFGAHEKKERKIILFYVYRTPDEGIFSRELNQLAQAHQGVELIEWCSAQKGRFSLSQAASYLPVANNYTVQLCGPLPMMESLKKQFMDKGIYESDIVYERFNLI